MIKTTKETHKQDETFKSKVTFDSYDNVYANVNGEMKSLPDYIASKGSGENVVTLDTDQYISGHKSFNKLSVANESKTDTFDITTDISIAEKANVVTFSREETSGYSLNEFILESGNKGNKGKIVLGSDVSKFYIKTMKAGDSLGITFNFPTSSSSPVEIATSDTIHKLTYTALTLQSGNVYKCTKYNPTNTKKSHVMLRLLNDGIVYTASFDIADAYEVDARVAFQLVYGSTSDDVATCFAYYKKDDTGYLYIDLDNAQLTSGYTLLAYYYQYN